MKCVIVYKDGSYTFWNEKHTWEYENDPDWFCTIPLAATAEPSSEMLSKDDNKVVISKDAKTREQATPVEFPIAEFRKWLNEVCGGTYSKPRSDAARHWFNRGVQAARK